MQVTNGDIWQAQKPLQELLDESWPVKTAYWLAKLGRKINDQYSIVEAVRVKLIKQYGTADDKGQTSISPTSAEWQKFADDFNELMAQEVEIQVDKIVLPDVDINVSPKTLIQLATFVDVAE